ncbi:MAG: yfkE [Acidimicrobiales bacterium]|jgi:Ca2+:H+ antiporter|nr:yfkE [Acidimicrobiales bacterium]
MNRPSWSTGWPPLAAAVLVPASIVARVANGSGTVTFVLAAAAVVPLAGMLGQATEQLAQHSGPRIGGLLNATFGNAAELIIGIFLVARGEIEVVRASLTGSIIGNLLLVLGAAFVAGGVRHRELRFSAKAASTHVVSMALAVAGILMPSIYGHQAVATAHRVEVISIWVAAVLIALYVAGLVYSLVTHADAFGDCHADPGGAEWSRRAALAVLAVVGVLVAVESEFLSSALESAVRSWGVSRLWLGLIVVPIVGNAAEHSTAVLVARKGQADLALDIAAGSSAQIALVVTPMLVFAGLLFNHHLTLSFSTFEVGALAVAVLVVALVALDGETNWLEGAQLVGLYAILAITSFYLGKV